MKKRIVGVRRSEFAAAEWARMACIAAVVTAALSAPAPARAQQAARQPDETDGAGNGKQEPVRGAVDKKIGDATKLFPAMYKAGNFDEIIRRCSTILGEPEMVTATGMILGVPVPEPGETPEVKPEADANALYWRGISAYQIGWYGRAEDDLTQARELGMEASGGQKILTDIARLKAFVPPNIYEVRSGDHIIFRVYYTQMDVLTKRVIQILGRAYSTNSKLLDSDLIETPVYIFNDYVQFYQFQTIACGSPPPSYALAMGGRGGFSIPLQARSGELAYDVRSNYLENVVTHELDHAMLLRAIGTVEMPNWFVEGLADLAGSELVLERKVANNRTLSAMLLANTLIAPSLLEKRDSFGAYTELGDAIRQAGVRKGAPSPYAQSFNMMRYLLNNIPPGDLPNFLLRVRTEQSFVKAFQEQFDATLPQFYTAWYQNLGPSLQR